MMRILSYCTLLLLVAWPTKVLSQDDITSPREQFGFDIGDDYQLANYTAFVEYWTTLAQESSRMRLEEIGKTAEGRPQLMAIITSPANHRRLTYYRGIARRLALAEDLTDRTARELAEQGKAVVWIDGGLHATEVLGAHQLMQLVYEFVSQDDPETLRILNDVIILATHANPDGMELVSNWYMREPVPEKRSTRWIPRLYQKYVGHDNNRDFFLSSQPETENINRILYREWFPQIVYNHHQTGPAGTVMFAPPFRDPFNYNYDPLLPLGIEMVGAAMHSRFVAEGKPGTTKRSGASYSTWWNGGLRTTPYFHNMIGLLTETIGNPTPVEIPFILDRQLPQNDITAPIPPQRWHFRQSIEYSMTANRAVLDFASRYRETLLYNIYVMGRNAIARGNRDSWTVHPKRIEAVRTAALQDTSIRGQNISRRRLPAELYERVLRDPELRDPRGYILSADQADFPTATKFVNTLIKNGVLVHQAERSFVIDDTRYAAGSYVVNTAQAFAPFVFDMFEPQDHPNDFAYPGGPPIPPYDNAGWTLAYQMGVEFDRILEGFEGPLRQLTDTVLPIEGRVANGRGAAGFLLSHQINDAATVTNRLLADDEEVFWLTDPVTVNRVTHPAGTIYIRAGSNTERKLETYAQELGINFFGVRNEPDAGAIRLEPVRIGLWDRYGGSMPSGWTRWILEQFEFPFDVVYAQELDSGDLAAKYDVLIFVDDAIPSEDRQEDGFSGAPDAGSIPSEYHAMLGRVTVAKTVPQLEQFLNSGGTVITIGSSTTLAYHFGLPVANHLVNEDGESLAREQYYMPGSIHRIRVDNSLPIAYGLGEYVNVHFNNSPVFDVQADTEQAGVRRVGWFDTDTPLMSGWAWGQRFLENGTTIVQADVGSGTLYLFGPEILRRAQPHGSFKFLFNGIHLAGASMVESTSTTGSN